MRRFKSACRLQLKTPCCFDDREFCAVLHRKAALSGLILLSNKTLDIIHKILYNNNEKRRSIVFLVLTTIKCRLSYRCSPPQSADLVIGAHHRKVQTASNHGRKEKILLPLFLYRKMLDLAVEHCYHYRRSSDIRTRVPTGTFYTQKIF